MGWSGSLSNLLDVNRLWIIISIWYNLLYNNYIGSYRKKSEDILKTSLIIPCLTCICGLLSSLVIFSYMGNMSLISGLSLD